MYFFVRNISHYHQHAGMWWMLGILFFLFCKYKKIARRCLLFLLLFCFFACQLSMSFNKKDIMNLIIRKLMFCRILELTCSFTYLNLSLYPLSLSIYNLWNKALTTTLLTVLMDFSTIVIQVLSLHSMIKYYTMFLFKTSMSCDSLQILIVIS